MTDRNLYSFPEVKEMLDTEPGVKFARQSWDGCKVVRMAVEADYDFVNFDIDGLIVTDCKKKICDCSIGIWTNEPEDELAEDWVKVP